MYRAFLLSPITDWFVRLAIRVRVAQLQAVGLSDAGATYKN